MSVSYSQSNDFLQIFPTDNIIDWSIRYLHRFPYQWRSYRASVWFEVDIVFCWFVSIHCVLGTGYHVAEAVRTSLHHQTKHFIEQAICKFIERWGGGVLYIWCPLLHCLPAKTKSTKQSGFHNGPSLLPSSILHSRYGLGLFYFYTIIQKKVS